MARKRTKRPTGILTVMVIVAGAALLLFVGNLVRGSQPRRVPMGVGEPANTVPEPPAPAEIEPEDRQQLENILRQKGKP